MTTYEITGLIESVVQKEKNYFYKIKDKVYGGLGEAEHEKGDTITMEIEDSGQWHNIKEVISVLPKSIQPLTPTTTTPKKKVEADIILIEANSEIIKEALRLTKESVGTDALIPSQIPILSTLLIELFHDRRTRIIENFYRIREAERK